jgi:hypothetical protein
MIYRTSTASIFEVCNYVVVERLMCKQHKSFIDTESYQGYIKTPKYFTQHCRVASIAALPHLDTIGLNL